VDFAKFGPVERKELSPHQEDQRRQPAPQLGDDSGTSRNHDDADITDLEAFRVAANKENEKSGIKVTMLAFLIKACVAALQEVPRVQQQRSTATALVLKQLLAHRLRRRHAQRPGRAGASKTPTRRACLQISAEMGELGQEGARWQARPGRHAGRPPSRSPSLGGIGGTLLHAHHQCAEVAILGVCRSSAIEAGAGTARPSQPRLMLPLSLDLTTTA